MFCHMMQKLIILNLFLILVHSSIKFTNLICTPVDRNYTYFEHCLLKPINRTYSYISVHAKLLQVTGHNITLKVSLLKRVNGYKPYLYDFSIDGCKFLAQRTNTLFKYAYSFVEGVSNINHTCPYADAIILEKLSNRRVENILTRLPWLSGEYAVRTKWFTENVLRATVDVYVSLFD